MMWKMVIIARSHCGDAAIQRAWTHRQTIGRLYNDTDTGKSDYLREKNPFFSTRTIDSLQIS